MPREKPEIKEVPDTQNPVPVSLQQSSVVETTAAFRKPRIPKLVLAGFAIILIVLLVVILRDSSTEPEIQQLGRTRAIQLDVQNGAGEAKLAQKLTEYLRLKGFDVVEMGNYKSSNIAQTMVIDRTGEIEPARAVAASLGIAEERVIQQVDKNLFLDVTVVIGKDFATLTAFQ